MKRGPLTLFCIPGRDCLILHHTSCFFIQPAVPTCPVKISHTWDLLTFLSASIPAHALSHVCPFAQAARVFQPSLCCSSGFSFFVCCFFLLKLIFQSALTAREKLLDLKASRRSRQSNYLVIKREASRLFGRRWSNLENTESVQHGLRKKIPGTRCKQSGKKKAGSKACVYRYLLVVFSGMGAEFMKPANTHANI